MSSAETSATTGSEAYSPSLAFTSLPVGVDNLRYDVFLSVGWRQWAQQFLFEQIVHQAQPYLSGLYPSDPHRRNAATAGFKSALDQLLRDALHRAKECSNIEVDLLARLACIKWLLAERQQQFSQLAITCKERVEKAGSDPVSGSMHAFVLRSRVSEYQSDRRRILNTVGEHLYQIFEELEEHSLRPGRIALFGSPFPDLYEVVCNRLIFMDNPTDASVHLEHYVMLGHFRGDIDDEEKVCTVVAELLREGLGLAESKEVASLGQQLGQRIEELHEMNRRLREVEAQEREHVGADSGRRRKLRWVGGWPRRADREDEATELEARRQELAAAVDELEREVAFRRQQDHIQIAEALSNPVNAERLFGTLSPTGTPEPRTPAQESLLRKLHTRLTQAGMLKYILANYYLKPIYKEFCPPLNPQQLKHAVVSRRGWEDFETRLGFFPAQDFPVEQLEDLARRLRHLSRSDAETVLVRFVRDLMRLRRASRHQQRLENLLEKIHLVVDDKTRRLSQLNRTLHEFLLPEESKVQGERVLTHVVVKADVRDSTSLTEELLRRGLNPATHLSFNFFEPVRKLMARYSASKIFIEGDALILGLYETLSNRASQRPVAKACLLAKEIVNVCQVYNQRARENELPILELGLGIAFHDAPPHYWEEGESRIMISSALNTADRLSSCTRLAQKLLGSHNGQFHVFQLQGPPAFGGSEEGEELLILYNVMGVALSEESFQKLQREISLSPIRMSADLLGQRESITLYRGTVPLGKRFEQLFIREARVPRIQLPGGHIQEWTARAYYEMCVDPRLYAESPTSA